MDKFLLKPFTADIGGLKTEADVPDTTTKRSLIAVNVGSLPQLPHQRLDPGPISAQHPTFFEGYVALTICTDSGATKAD